MLNNTSITTTAQIIGIEDRTDDIRILTLKPAQNINNRPGQYIFVLGGGHDPRPFSIANANQDELVLHVRTVGSGLSEFLARETKIGDTLDIDGPHGDMSTTIARARPVFMVAGGTGIVPMLSMCQDIIKTGITESGITLLYGVRTENDIYCRKELEALQASGELTIHYCIGDNTPDKMLHTLNPNLSGNAVYLSGPIPMQNVLSPVLELYGAKYIQTDIPLNITGCP